MDPVEKLWESMPDPVPNGSDSQATRSARLNALAVFFSQHPRPGINIPDTLESRVLAYLSTDANNPLVTKRIRDANFRETMGEFALDFPPAKRDKSARAIQLRYYRWMAQGRKNETYPFRQGKYEGLPSATRLSQLVRPTNATKCAACGKADGGRLRCPDCDFNDETRVLEVTAYCNRTCWENHRESHKRTCTDRQCLYRVSRLLDTAYTKMLVSTCVSRPTKIFEENGVIYINQTDWLRVGMTGRHLFAPFLRSVTDPVTAGKDEAAGELLHRGILHEKHGHGDLTFSFAPLIEYLLEGKFICPSSAAHPNFYELGFAKKVQLVTYNVANVRQPLAGKGEQHSRAFNNVFSPHNAVLVTLRSKETYVIDVNSCAYGWGETLAPWNKWSALRVAGDAFVTPWARTPKPREAPDGELIAAMVCTEARQRLIASLIKSMKLIAENKPFSDLLACSTDHFEPLEDHVTELLASKVHILITAHYRKGFYRLFANCDRSLQMARHAHKLLKRVWLTRLENAILTDRKTLSKMFGLEGVALLTNCYATALFLVSGLQPHHKLVGDEKVDLSTFDRLLHDEIRRNLGLPERPAGSELPASELPAGDVVMAEGPTNEVPTNKGPEVEEPTNEMPTLGALKLEALKLEALTRDVPPLEALTRDVPSLEALTRDVPSLEALTLEDLARDVPPLEALTGDVPTLEALTLEALTRVEPKDDSPTDESSDGD
ncbi:hypothetical protein GGS20DRAFT_585280 [Poronia punctata]|nr:hypothetical protein GGS20DRAFT_585280 [Poronia punctata]